MASRTEGALGLRHRLERAGGALLALLDPEQDAMPTGGYEVAHDLGRWWDAALRLEEAIGFVIPAEAEAASLRHLQALTDNPDRLLMNRPDVPGLRDGAKINPHNFRETLLAFGGLIRRRNSLWAREAALELVGALDRCLQPDGRLDLTRLGSWGRLPMTDDPSHTEPDRSGWFDSTATSGRSLEALVWLYEATEEPKALDLATRIAEHHLAHSTRPEGQVREEILDPQNVGHCHSYLGTLRGLLLYGLLTRQRRFVEAVSATYRSGVRNRIVRESGWAPHDLGKMRFPNALGDPVTDPASAGDAAQLALWLGLHAGEPQWLDDAERLVRARLFPAQRVEGDAAPRERGAWCIHGPSHAGKGCTPDVLAAVTHTLCDLYRHLVTATPTGLQVHFHFDYEDSRLRVESVRGARGAVRVVLHQPADLWIRVPGWAPAASLELTIDGKERPIRRLGAYAGITRDTFRPGSPIALSYDLPARETEEAMPSGRRYRFRWRGDEIIGIHPQDQPRPFYPES